ncbi:GGDEF domain-containing protein [Sneathiella limimaris]|uniref:GGDEF domain-containing protein n=1 Tax=Sneathiella limimaris TaxID=1964213 RepID=UPI00146F456D|nr:sensor domain-containing diguanylate cyclase [Sneathiella limimaris]
MASTSTHFSLLQPETGEQASILQDAMENMAHGFAVWDRDLNILLYSRRFLEFWDIDEDFVAAHPNLRDILRVVLMENGVTAEDVDAVIAERTRLVEEGQTEFTSFINLASGRVIENFVRFTPAGRWVITYTDITERRKAELELQAAATTDALTGLANRSAFYERSLQMLSLSAHKRRGLPVLMMDIDYFKQVNDDFGHDAGDKLLVLVAETLGASIRPYDIVARLGGEEFAAVLSDTDPDAAYRVAERIRKAVATLQLSDQPDLRISMSIGIAFTKADATDIDEALKVADTQLYLAKEKGRNRVEMVSKNR